MAKAPLTFAVNESTPLVGEHSPASTTQEPPIRVSSTTRPVRTPKIHFPDGEEEGCYVVMPSGHSLYHDGSIIHQYGKDKHKIFTYDPECVVGWEALWTYSNSVFQKTITIQALVQSSMICAVVAICTFVLPSGPLLKTKEINHLVNFMMAFLAFMTGIFVNAAFNRWQSIVQNLNLLLKSIKALQVDLEAMGCPRQDRHRMRRWSLASIFLTAFEAPENWTTVNWDRNFEEMEAFGVISEVERTYLMGKDHKAALPWSWITMTIKDLSDRNLLPSKQTPSYCLLLADCNSAEHAIQSIDQLCLLQMPYQYVHMLAWLIHVFNIVNAIRCGVEIGIIVAVTRRQGQMVPTAQESQALFTYTLIMMLAPTIYQAFLTIALDIAIPFGNGDTDLPIAAIVDRFSNELQELEEHDEILKQYRENAAG